MKKRLFPVEGRETKVLVDELVALLEEFGTGGYCEVELLAAEGEELFVDGG